jgi:hypothetical protein
LRKRKSRQKTKSVAGIIDPATYTADGEYRYMEVGDRFTLRDEFVARAPSGCRWHRRLSFPPYLSHVTACIYCLLPHVAQDVTRDAN